MDIKIDYDSGYKCGTISCESLDLIREHFSVVDKSAKIRRRFNPYIPLRKYAITPAGRFGVGLFAEIFKVLQSFNKPLNYIISPRFKAIYQPAYSLLNTPLNALQLDLRDYQEDCVRKCLKQGNGTVLLATAGGKTLLSASLIHNIQKRTKDHFTLLLVPTLQLVEQTYNDFIEYGIPKESLTRLSGEHDFQLGSSIIIALAQYLMVSKSVPESIFEVDLLIIDEVHGLKRGNQLDKLTKKFVTPHKFGLTGSLPENKIDIWNILGKMGPIIYEKSSHDLRQAGYLADIETTIIKFHYNEEPLYEKVSMSNPLKAYTTEQEFVISHPWRNEKIAALAAKTPKNTLIIVDRIVHGEIFKRHIKKVTANKKVYFIQGSVNIRTREKVRKLMESSDNVVCIAIAKIFSTGINIKNLHYIILAISGKAKVRLIQSIGRGLRLHENKDKLYLIDIADQLKYAEQHELERIKIYEQECIKYKYHAIYEEGAKKAKEA